MRTTWMPYWHRVPTELQQQFFDEIVDDYLETHSMDAEGRVSSVDGSLGSRGGEATKRLKYGEESNMSNQIMVIAPYWLERRADAGYSMIQQPVCSKSLSLAVCRRVIEFLTGPTIPNARNGFRLLFSHRHSPAIRNG